VNPFDSQAQRVEVDPLGDGPLLPDQIPDWRREEWAAEDREEELSERRRHLMDSQTGFSVAEDEHWNDADEKEEIEELSE